MGDQEGTLQIEYDDISMKRKPILTRFGGTFGTLMFNEKLFFNTLLSFTPFWDYKLPYAFHAVSRGVYTSERILNLSAINKIHSKSDVIDSFIVSGSSQPISFSFVLDKPSGYKLFCEPETIHYKKMNRSVLNTITIHLEDDFNGEVVFNGATLTFTLKVIKI